MADGDDRGVGQHGLAEDDADIDGGLGDAALRDAYFLDKAVVLIEQQYPELLDVEVLHQGVHLVVDLSGRV